MQGGHNKKLMSSDDYMAKIMREVWGEDKKIDKKTIKNILKELPPPDWIGEYGQRLWNEILPQLLAFEILTKADLPVLEMLCSNYDQYRRADDEIKEHGLVVEGVRGMPKKNPAVEIREKAWKSFLSAAEHFGLTPLARNRMQIVPEIDDEFEGLID